MKNPLRAACVFTYFVFSILLMRTNMEAQAVADAHVQEVTATEYCNFLNQVAVSDPNHLYDDAMSTDPETACIVRLGTPGNFHYEVIEGRENFPVTYVSLLDEEKYCAETDNVISADDKNEDPSLRSNRRGFAVDTPSSPTLTLAVAAPTSTSNFNSYIEDAGIVAFITFGAALVTIEDFRQALADPANAQAERLLIVRDGENEVIRAEDARRFEGREANHDTLNHLRRALQSEHSSLKIANEIISEVITPIALISDCRLSAVRLQQILDVSKARRSGAAPASPSSTVPPDRASNQAGSGITPTINDFRKALNDHPRAGQFYLDRSIIKVRNRELNIRNTIDRARATVGADRPASINVVLQNALNLEYSLGSLFVSNLIPEGLTLNGDTLYRILRRVNFHQAEATIRETVPAGPAAPDEPNDEKTKRMLADVFSEEQDELTVPAVDNYKRWDDWENVFRLELRKNKIEKEGAEQLKGNIGHQDDVSRDRLRNAKSAFTAAETEWETLYRASEPSSYHADKDLFAEREHIVDIVRCIARAELYQALQAGRDYHEKQEKWIDLANLTDSIREVILHAEEPEANTVKEQALNKLGELDLIRWRYLKWEAKKYDALTPEKKDQQRDEIKNGVYDALRKAKERAEAQYAGAINDDHSTIAEEVRDVGLKVIAASGQPIINAVDRALDKTFVRMVNTASGGVGSVIADTLHNAYDGATTLVSPKNHLKHARSEDEALVRSSARNITTDGVLGLRYKQLKQAYKALQQRWTEFPNLARERPVRLGGLDPIRYSLPADEREKHARGPDVDLNNALNKFMKKYKEQTQQPPTVLSTIMKHLQNTLNATYDARFQLHHVCQGVNDGWEQDDVKVSVDLARKQAEAAHEAAATVEHQIISNDLCDELGDVINMVQKAAKAAQEASDLAKVVYDNAFK